MIASTTTGDWWPIIKARPLSGFPKRKWNIYILFVFILFVVVYGLNHIAIADPSPFQRVLGSSIVVVCAIPGFLWLGGRGYSIPFIPMICGAYAIHYAFPVFILHRYSRHIFYGLPSFPGSVVDQTLILSLLGLISLLIGFHSGREKWMKWIVPKVNMRWINYRHIIFLSVLLAFTGLLTFWARLLIPIPTALHQVVNLVTDLTLVSIVALFALQLTGRLNFPGKCFLWTVFIIRILMGLGTASVGEVLRTILPLILVYTAIRRRIPWKTILIGAVLFFALRPAKGAVYEISSPWVVGGGHEYSIFKRGVLYIDVAMDLLTEPDRDYLDYVRMIWWRLSYFIKFAQVINSTVEEGVPLWMGESYYPLLFKPIPRLIYPDKPKEQIGQVFGHRYGLLMPTDDSTFVTLPFLVEFYANFGMMGVFIGMFVVGVLFRFLDHMFVHPGVGLGGIVAFSFICGKLGDLEIHVSGGFGQLFFWIPFFAVLHFFMSKSPSQVRK